MDEKVFSVSAKDLMRTDFLSVQGNNSASELTGKLVNSKYNNVVVFEGNKYYGMASLRALLRRRIDLSKVKAKNLSEKKPSITEDTGFFEIVKLMQSSDARILPVIKDDKVIGVVPIQKVMDVIKDVNSLQNKKADEFDSKSIVTIKEEESLGKAMKLMSEQKIKRLVVVRGFKVAGILEYKNVVQKIMVPKKESKSAKRDSKGFGTNEDSAFESPVSNFMNTNVALVNSKDSFNEVINAVRKNGLAVVANNLRPKGIITNNSLLEAVLGLQEEIRNVQIVSMPKIDEIDYSIIENVITRFYDKTEKKIKQKPLLRVHFKQAKTSGLRRKHLINLLLAFGGYHLSVQTENWTLINAVQDAFKAMENKVHKSLKE